MLDVDSAWDPRRTTQTAHSDNTMSIVASQIAHKSVSLTRHFFIGQICVLCFETPPRRERHETLRQPSAIVQMLSFLVGSACEEDSFSMCVVMTFMLVVAFETKIWPKRFDPLFS